ncbi:MAG: bifunctional helix-turn-helix transcriptional regulator/GNAT family N-acetyltransferase [Chloroflexota bacterium]|nr:bifunctional helix-turn-helix transcriptional regulator/GNAT family N-acetyltransferase [Chloroflexota bacterium]
MQRDQLEPRVAAIRHFNRFYTRQIGVLAGGYLASPFSLTEVRILYELAYRPGTLAAADLSRELGLDAGYLSRVLRRFDRHGFLTKQADTNDRRRTLLALTAAGQAAFAPLDRRSHEEIAASLDQLDDGEQRRLLAAMRSIEELLGGVAATSPPIILRGHAPGDLGWVVHRHGALYFQEYRLNEEFEALVAEVAASFLQHFDPARERCWIAERGGEIVGSVLLVRATTEVAKLRLLLVEPSARGVGLGRRLVQECVTFARRAKYREIELWTIEGLGAARRLYEEVGFRLVASEPQHRFGHDVVGQTWKLRL